MCLQQADTLLPAYKVLNPRQYSYTTTYNSVPFINRWGLDSQQGGVSDLKLKTSINDL